VGAPPLTMLVCPACRDPLDERLACPSCGTRYGGDNGIPILLPPDEHDGSRERQAAWFDMLDPEYEIERPSGTPAFHAWLLEEKFRRGTSELGDLLDGGTALAVCGGSGMDAELLARAGARAFSADVSPGAARRASERARRHGVELVSLVADGMALPFADRSFDVVYVHDGLHHVDRPLAVLAEMARVARHAVSVNEPARAVATSAAIRMGLALEREAAGNRVRRLSVGDVTDVLRRRGFRILRAERYAMLYRHEAGPLSRALSGARTQPVATRAQGLLDLLGARVGNKLTVQAVRE
jgi:ubiquinone/menaquinone biosynthesis C-methylase UbiE/uncharacterized protein YbaR (Trm112 family)